MRIAKPDTLADLGTLGLSLAESKQLLAGIQREIVAAQARLHAVHRPECRGCGGACRVKDSRQHAIATPFGEVAVRLPRFRCAACATTEAGVGWPSHARSTPELDRLRAQLSALMPYRTAAEVLAQLFPVAAARPLAPGAGAAAGAAAPPDPPPRGGGGAGAAFPGGRRRRPRPPAPPPLKGPREPPPAGARRAGDPRRGDRGELGFDLHPE